MQGDEVVACARGWLGTPYRHQASVKGVGSDCLGLIRGVWREMRGCEPVAVPDYTRDWSEAGGEERLLNAAGAFLRPVGGVQAPGDVLVFRMRRGSVAKHLGIVSGDASFIHSYERAGVIESPLTDGWVRRIAGIFRFS